MKHEDDADGPGGGRDMATAKLSCIAMCDIGLEALGPKITRFITQSHTEFESVGRCARTVLLRIVAQSSRARLGKIIRVGCHDIFEEKNDVPEVLKFGILKKHLRTLPAQVKWEDDVGGRRVFREADFPTQLLQQPSLVAEGHRNVVLEQQVVLFDVRLLRPKVIQHLGTRDDQFGGSQ